MKNLEYHREAQNIARDTIVYLKSNVQIGMTERKIKEMAEEFMRSKGVQTFWYYNIGAFVLIGKNSIRSISGRNYIASGTELVTDGTIITVDLSPIIKDCWGDFARSFVIGTVSENIRNGLKIEKILHKKFLQIVSPEMTCEEIYTIMNKIIRKLGCNNLDFNKNIGHSIVSDSLKRIYLEKGSHASLKELQMFTFEPHISFDNKIGFKRENIYYFDEDGKIQEL